MGRRFRHCGSFGLVVHLMRARGTHPLLVAFDEAVKCAAREILGSDADMVFRPARRAGMGLRLSALHAAPAYVASACAAASLAPLLLADPSSLAPDVSIAEMAQSPELATFPDVQQSMLTYSAAGTAAYGDRMQKTWSTAIEVALCDGKLAAAGDLERARLLLRPSRVVVARDAHAV